LDYQNPGSLFIAKYGAPEDIDDVLKYVQFLRDESGLIDELPVNLDRVYKRFGIPKPARLSLPDQQGLLLNPEKGLIVINDKDRFTRQRFSEAHELLELLFSQIATGNAWAARQHGPFRRPTKERLCNQGAAELLMPKDSFLPRLFQIGVSFNSARLLAKVYLASTTAALVHMARIGPGQHAVVLWQLKHKPVEIQRMSNGQQLSLFGDPNIFKPSKKLRVTWAISKPGSTFIPKHISAPEASSILEAWTSGSDTKGEDILELGNNRVSWLCENHPFEANGEQMVISLIHLTGDVGCEARL
jgi:hypothetical protein